MKNKAAQQLGKLGGIARSKSLTPERRKEIALKAVQAREEKKRLNKLSTISSLQ